MFVAAAVAHPESIDLVTPFYHALRDSGLSQKQLAAMMAISEPQLYQQLRGVGHLSMLRLLSVSKDPDGRRFLRSYWPRVAEASGFPEVADALKAAEAFAQLVNRLQVSMANADLDRREVHEERKSA